MITLQNLCLVTLYQNRMLSVPILAGEYEKSYASFLRSSRTKARVLLVDTCLCSDKKAIVIFHFEVDRISWGTII